MPTMSTDSDGKAIPPKLFLDVKILHEDSSFPIPSFEQPQ